ncbi:MAG: DUF6444 domain-containing protein [Clostridium sp.]|nr:DUF6444 domain-containing protein [Clostridium sp.]
MKQQAKDINETLSGLFSELQSLRKTIDSLYSENCSLNRNVDKLLKENRELRKRLEKYEKPPKDSNNSSTPPLKEPVKSEIECRAKSLREKSGKSVGGQKGHEGTTLKMIEIPDEVEEVKSLCCKNCGRDLSGLTPELERTSQEIDLPQVRPVYRERRFYKDDLHMRMLQPLISSKQTWRKCRCLCQKCPADSNLSGGCAMYAL